MPRIPGIRRAFHDPRQHAAAEVDDEFAFHLEQRTRELIAAGWLPDAARAEALRLFGDLEDARAYCRQLDTQRERHTMRTEILGGLRQDLTLALRSLRRSPGFTLAAIATLALGIGANVAMFGIVDRLLLRPPAHVAEPDLVRRLYFTETKGGETDTAAQMSYPRYLALGESMRPVGTVSVFYTTELILGENEGAGPARVTLASSTFLPALGVRLARGRFFTADEDVPPSGSRVAVISHSLWQGRLGGAPDVIGQRLTIGGQPFEIVGVTPAGFTGIDPEPVDAWVPVTAFGHDMIGKYSDEPWYQVHNVGWLRGIVRVHREGLIAQGNLLATVGFRRALEARWPAARVDSMRPAAALEPLLLERGPDRTPSARIAMWLAGMSLLVLLIACANVANLLLARGLQRRREMAVRVALGAGRARLVAQLLTEGLLIAVLGGIAAMVVAATGGGLVRRLLLPGVEWEGALFDARTLAMGAIAVIGTGLLIGLMPAFQASDMNVVGSLKAGAREGGGRRSRTRGALVVLQASLSLVLLAGAGLFVRSLHNARNVDLGFAADRVLAVHLPLEGSGYTTAEGLALYERLHERTVRIPGVQHASLAVTEPFATTLDFRISIPGRDSVQLPPSGPPRANAVTPEFFATMGTIVVAGRSFSTGDRRGSALVTVVNETMARALWPGRSALGERFCIVETKENPCFEIVGIARDARWQSLGDEPTMQMYFPLEQDPTTVPLRVLFLRASGDPAALIRAVRDEARAVAPRVMFAEVQPLAGNLEPQMRPWRLGATVFTVFGGLALILAGLGLYSVIAYDVTQRTREMGVRLALGAGTVNVLRLIVGDGVRLASLGIFVGIAIALAAGRWIGPLLFDTTPNDPLVLGSVAVVLFVVSVAASLIPAMRATRVAPATALRTE